MMKGRPRELAFNRAKNGRRGCIQGAISAALDILRVLVLVLTLFLVPAWAQVTINPGDILVVDANAQGGNGAVIIVNPTNGAQTVLSSGGLFVEPVGIVESTADGFIYVTDRNRGDVIRVNPNTGSQSVIAPGFVDPFGITVSSTGTLFITDTDCPTHASPPCLSASSSRVPKIFSINPATTPATVTLVSSNQFLCNPFGIEIEASGTTLVVSDNCSATLPFTGAGGIIRVNTLMPATNNQTVVVVGTAGIDGCPFGITVDQVGRVLTSVFDPSAFPPYGCAPGALWRTATAAGPNMPFSPHNLIAWMGPFGMVVDTNGTILVVDEF